MNQKEKTQKLPVSPENILATLSKDNCYVWINPEDSTDIQLYYLKERRTDTSFHLPSLRYSLEHRLRGDVEFQRDSDDHKSGENEDFVLDYITGHYMGDITLWNHPVEIPKWIVNGKHRLTALADFHSNNLVLKGRYAKRFWTHFLPEIIKLIGRGNTEFNKVLDGLSNNKLPKVVFRDLPVSIQQEIVDSVAISSSEVDIVCKNLDGTIRNDGDIDVMKEIIWNKYFNMNNNIAVIKVEDTLWASLSHYNLQTKRMSFFKTFGELFNIKTITKKVNNVEKTSLDEYKKLNEVLMAMMYFIDKKHNWNGSTKALSKKVNQFQHKFQDENAESKEFVKYFNTIEKNFVRLFQNGDNINFPEGIKGIKGNLTNIRYMLYFMYMIHTFVKPVSNTIPLYSGDVPSPIHRALLELAANIIVSSNFGDSSEITEEHPIYQNGLGRIYEENQSVFVRLNDFRKSQRSKEVMDELMFDLFTLCFQYIS